MFTLSQQAHAAEYLRSLKPHLASHVSMNFSDAQIKYSFLFRSITESNFGLEARILDLGCGDGHVSQTLANLGYANVVAVDAVRRRFIKDRPGRPKDIFMEKLGDFKKGVFFFRKPKYKFIRSDALQFLSLQEANSFDLVIDGCSITHFNTKPADLPWPSDINIGFVKSLQEVYRMLRPGGIFISAMDLYADDLGVASEKREFFSEDSFRKTVRAIFQEVEFDVHDNAWQGTSEVFKFIISESGRPRILGVSGVTARKSKQ